MDPLKTTRDGSALVGCLLYGFLLAYLISGMLYHGEIRPTILAGGLAFGYFLRILLL